MADSINNTDDSKIEFVRIIPDNASFKWLKSRKGNVLGFETCRDMTISEFRKWQGCYDNE